MMNIKKGRLKSTTFILKINTYDAFQNDYGNIAWGILCYITNDITLQKEFIFEGSE